MTCRALSGATSMVVGLALGLAGVAAPSAAAPKPKPYKVKLSLSAASTTVGTPVTASGKVRPKAPKKKVKLQEQVGGHWQTLIKTKLTKKSAYSFSYTPTTVGTHVLRVQKGAGSGHPKGASRSATLTATATPGGFPSGSRLAVGRYHSCVAVNGSVKCWGLNSDGQLGTGAAIDSDTHPTPVVVPGITDATAVGAGSGTSCAVVTGGQVKCWGDNLYGQFGTGATGSDSSTPVLVPGVTGAVAVDIGSQQVCALLSTGSISCWGRNTMRVLGNTGVAVDTISAPVLVSGVTTATSLDVGVTVSCAVLANHNVTCWGGNDAGQLGDGTEDPRTAPVAVTGINDATAVAVGSFHACAVVTAGAVKCWGDNLGGMTGTASPPDEVHTPTLVPGVSGATAVAAGESHSCAVLAAGAMSCWGSNDHGQLGTGAGVLSPNQPPTAVSGLAGGVTAGAGTWHTCTLVTSGGVLCWGSNFYGQLGNGDGSHGLSNSPVAVLGLP